MSLFAYYLQYILQLSIPLVKVYPGASRLDVILCLALPTPRIEPSGLHSIPATWRSLSVRLTESPAGLKLHGRATRYPKCIPDDRGAACGSVRLCEAAVATLCNNSSLVRKA